MLSRFGCIFKATMQQSSKTMLGVAGVIVIALILFFVLHQPQPSDQEQIVAQMEAARNAAAHHDTRGVMQEFSADYKGQTELDSNIDQLHLLLARSLGRGGSLDVQLSAPAVAVQGSAATSRSHLQVRTREDGAVRYDQDVTLHWKQENGMRLLVFPTKVWRIVGAEFPAPNE